MTHSAEYVAWLEAELRWAYRQIMGDTEDTQEVAAWRAFNGSKKLGARIDGSPFDHEPDNPQGVWCCEPHRQEFFDRHPNLRHNDGSMHPAACGPRCRSQHTDDHSRCEQIDGSDAV